jgi:wyosine [tRNA(Phe)-imidazoG37] synthetase (radical SAM superfamily)
MSTFLFDKIVFGPVISRRLGISLGINLLPVDSKICSFDCIYCECGRNPRKPTLRSEFPGKTEVKIKLGKKLSEMKVANRLPDVITFAGNGEPTLHPQFQEIIEDTILLRDEYAPRARIAVLSNATMLHKPAVFESLLKIEDNIQKLDSALPETINLLNCPHKNFSLPKVVDQLKAFKGKVIIQTMFLRGTYNGIRFDNTVEREISAWIGLLREIKPSLVMIYTIARDTPVDTIEKVSTVQLHEIAGKVKSAGFKIQVSG